MKRLCFVTALFCAVTLSGLLTSCSKEESADEPISFKVYGFIVDKMTGEPVYGAEVSLYAGSYSSYIGVGSSIANGCIGSTVTGSTGHFEMHCTINENLMNEVHNTYTLYITAYGRNPYKKEVTMTVSEGLSVQLDAAIY